MNDDVEPQDIIEYIIVLGVGIAFVAAPFVFLAGVLYLILS